MYPEILPEPNKAIVPQLERLSGFFSVHDIASTKAQTIGQIISLGILLSSFTLPYVWFLFPWVSTIWLTILLKEMVVVVIEAVLLKTIGRLTWRTSIVLSLMTNVASYLVGLAMGYWL